MAVKVGELYAELGLRDELTKASKQVSREFDQIVKGMHADAKLGLDATELAKAADKADAQVKALRKEIAEKQKMGVDTSELRVKLTEAEETAKRAQKQLREKVTARMDGDSAALESEVKKAKSQLADFEAEKPTVPVDADTKPMEKELDAGGGKVASAVSGWAVGVLVAAAALGAKIGSEIVGAVGDAIERDMDTDRLAASLGLDAATAARTGRISGKMWAAGWGESVDEVNRAMEAVSVGLLDPATTGDFDLAIATAMAMDFARTFDQDVTQSVRAASDLVRNGLARDFAHAFDIMTRGMQEGNLGMRDDLLDTYNEYAVHLSALGISADEATAAFVRLGDQGVWNSDKGADALKEFAIRAVDGSETTRDAFKAMGLPYEQFRDALLKGGPEAKQALSTIIRELGRLNPAAREIAGVSLFGTMFEDLKYDAIAALDPMLGGLNDVDGAAVRLSDTLNDNVGTKLESLKRKFSPENLFAAFQEGGFDGLAAEFSEGIDDLKALWDEYGPAVMEALGEFKDEAKKWWDENGEEVLSEWGTWMGEVGGPALIDFLGTMLGVAFTGAKAYLTAELKAFFGQWAEEQSWHLLGLGLGVVNWVKGLPGQVATAAVGMWDSIVEELRRAINRAIQLWNDNNDLFSVGGVTIGGPNVDYIGLSPTETALSDAAQGVVSQFRRHAGGMFRAPAGQSEGWAQLRDGEHVVTPEEIAAAVRGGGSQGDGRPLVVQVALDGRVLAESTTPYFLAMRRSGGGIF